MHATLPTAFQPLITRDLTATALAAVGAYVWVRLFDWMATQGVLEQVEADPPCFGFVWLHLTEHVCCVIDHESKIGAHNIWTLICLDMAAV